MRADERRRSQRREKDGLPLGATVELADPNDTLTEAMMIKQCEPYFDGAIVPA
jgi:hypothetical protein